MRIECLSYKGTMAAGKTRLAFTAVNVCGGPARAFL
jgi:hypothetical protein